MVEKIKDEKGEFWCNFSNVRKLSGPFSMPRAFVGNLGRNPIAYKGST